MYIYPKGVFTPFSSGPSRWHTLAIYIFPCGLTQSTAGSHLKTQPPPRCTLFCTQITHIWLGTVASFIPKGPQNGMQALIHIHMSSYVTIVSSRSHRKRSKVYTIQLRRRFAVKQIKRRMCSARAAMIRHFVSLTTYRIVKKQKKKTIRIVCSFTISDELVLRVHPSPKGIYILFLFVFFLFEQLKVAQRVYSLCANGINYTVHHQACCWTKMNLDRQRHIYIYIKNRAADDTEWVRSTLLWVVLGWRSEIQVARPIVLCSSITTAPGRPIHQTCATGIWKCSISGRGGEGSRRFLCCCIFISQSCLVAGFIKRIGFEMFCYTSENYLYMYLVVCLRVLWKKKHGQDAQNDIYIFSLLWCDCGCRDSQKKAHWMIKRQIMHSEFHGMR